MAALHKLQGWIGGQDGFDLLAEFLRIQPQQAHGLG
jgi:hypothetical protein